MKTLVKVELQKGREPDTAVNTERKNSIQRFSSCRMGYYGQLRESDSSNSRKQCTEIQKEIKQNSTRSNKVIKVLI